MNPYKYILGVLTLLFSTLLYAQETLSLEHAKELALVANHKIKQEALHTKAAEAAKTAVYTKNKPFSNASVTGLHFGDPINVLLPENMVAANIGVNQVIYTGGKINASKELMNNVVELHKSKESLTHAEVLLEVETVYWQIINVKEKIVLIEKSKTLLHALLQDLTNSFEAGIIYKNDVLRVQVELNKTELNLTKAEDGLTLLKLKMAQLTGLENSDFIINESLDESTVLSIETNNNTIENRPEVKMLQNALKIQESETKILSADRKPTVALSINGIYNAGSNINFTDGSNDFTSYFGVLNISIPIFDWGDRKHKVKEQQYKVEAQKLELIETEELLSLQVNDELLKLKQAQKQVEITKKSLVQAEENLRLNQDRFDAGTVVGKDLLEAQVLWQQAFAEIIDAKALLKIQEVKYKKAIGELE